MDYAMIGARICAARRARGLTQEQVAATAGTSQPTISDLERGVRPAIAFERLVAVAVAVGVDVSTLVAQGEEMLP